MPTALTLALLLLGAGLIAGAELAVSRANPGVRIGWSGPPRDPWSAKVPRALGAGTAIFGLLDLGLGVWWVAGLLMLVVFLPSYIVRILPNRSLAPQPSSDGPAAG